MGNSFSQIFVNDFNSFKKCRKTAWRSLHKNFKRSVISASWIQNGPVFMIAYIKISSTDNLLRNCWVRWVRIRQDNSIVTLARDIIVLSFPEAHSDFHDVFGQFLCVVFFFNTLGSPYLLAYVDPLITALCLKNICGFEK